MKRLRWVLLALLGGMTACSQVQPWQKEVLSLEPMLYNDCPVHRFERNVEVYREGAAGGNGGKSGGGCGCS